MSLKERLGFDKEPLYLIDGTAAIYRAFYAMQDMKRADGFPTNALFIVLRVLLKLLREEKPRYIAFFLDGPGPTFRHKLFEPYKAQRDATPEPLIQQIEPVKRAMALLGVRAITSSGVEADDLMASLAARFKSERPVVLVAADKDLKQCLDKRVIIWDPSGKQERLITLATFQEDTGLSPSQWPDFQALTGDSSDNIPGVPGVGPKTASKVLEKLPTLEDLRQGLDQLTPSERKKIEPHVDALFDWRELTRLKTDELGDSELKDYRRQAPDGQALAEFLQEFEFRTMLRELPETLAALAQAGDETQTLDIAADHAPEARTVRAAKSLDELPDLAKREVALLHLDEGPRLGIGRAGDAPGGEWKWEGGAAELVQALQQAARVASPDFKALLHLDEAFWGLRLERCFDLGLAGYLLNPEERDYGFEQLLKRHDIPQAPDNPGLAALALSRELAKRVEVAGLEKLMAELEMPLIPVLADMERAGVAIDTIAFAQFLEEVRTRLDHITERIYKHAGGSFNLRSAQQLGQLLFETLGLKPAGKTPKGQPSTSHDALEKLAGQHPVVEEILEFRKLEKLRSTYLEPLPRLVAKDGRIHTTFNQLATATGRLSSSNPNLQNIPIRSDLGARMRTCFTAARGKRLVAADYSQIELRVLAHFSRDATLLDAFSRDQDIHRRTAALLFDVEPDQVDKSQRGKAKTINFGLIYGMGPQKLAQDLKISTKEAKAFIDRYFERLTGLRDFYEQVENLAKEQGFVTTLAGRRRFVPDIHSDNNQLQAQARRQAINTLIQGSAADVIKMAMLAVHRDERLRELEARLLLQVHDELVLECPAASAKEAGERVGALMSGVVKLEVPLQVDWGEGADWGAAH